MRRWLGAWLLLGALWIAGAAAWAQVKLPDPEAAMSDPAMERLTGYLCSQRFEKGFLGGSTKPVFLPETSPEARMVAEVTARLAAVIALDRPTMSLTAKVVKSPELNAFCLPGGYVYVYSGLLDFIEKKYPDHAQDVLAAVLGHEISHAVLRHTLVTWANAKDFKQILSDKATFEKLVTQMSRTQELEADRYGALYATRAGYRFSAAIELFRDLPQPRSTYADTDHPGGDERVKQLTAYQAQLQSVVELWPDALRAISAQKYEQARVCLEIIRAEFPQLPSVHTNLGWVAYEQYIHSLPATMKAERPQVAYTFVENLGVTVRGMGGDEAALTLASNEFDTALRLDPGSASAYEGAAACALERGDVAKAQDMVGKALKVAPHDAAVENVAAVTYARAGQQPDAVQAWNLALKSDANYLPALYNLADAYVKSGQQAQAQQLFGRYLMLDKSGFWAEQARQKLAKVGVNVPAAAPVQAESKAAGVEVGASTDQVRSVLGAPGQVAKLPGGGEEYRYPQQGVALSIEESSVNAITITSPAAGSVAGVKVGMTRADVEKTLGAPTSMSVGERSILYLQYPALGISVGLRSGVVAEIVVAGR